MTNHSDAIARLSSRGPASCIRDPKSFLTLCSIAVVLLVPVKVPAEDAPSLPAVSVTQSATGLHAVIGNEVVDVTACADGVIHVVTQADANQSHPPQQPWLLPAGQSCPGVKFSFTRDSRAATLATSKMKATLDLRGGALSFFNADGSPLVSESSGVPRTYAPETLNGEQTFHIVDRFVPNSLDAFYGLGQHQSGLFNYRGATVELGQNNTDIAIPFLVSNSGYALLWNTAAFTYVDNRFPRELSFDSLAGNGVDYFVIAGPEMDELIHQYRNLTGHSPMLPRWSYGYIQSKDRYKSLDEIQSIAARYRKEHIPIDVMVQDWFWWKTEGDPEFNDNYHDVPGDLKKLHDMHFHTMISTWGMLDTKSNTFREMDSKGFLIPNAHVYDPSIPAARKMYWDHLNGPLFAEGWDSFWLDSAEPEEYWPHSGDAILRTRKIAIGNGAEYTNVFPLLHNEGIQEHWRQANDQKRTFLLTRSSFLGQQRVGGTVWSGDVNSTFSVLARQVSAGLNYALSGLPYWTTDIGGYWPVYDGQPTDPAYQELYLRWFQFGAFCPIFRSHGHRPHNEFWTYPDVEPSLIAFDKLRYRMLPYIYSLAWRVSSEDYTLQRPLVMDFRGDPNTWNIGDQFMFGPALLVNPVLEDKARERRVYLPKNTDWYDFWTGEKVQGGRHLEADAPLERLPLYVRAGSILPLGPDEEWAGEKQGPIELRIYEGADAKFTLYEDEGDNYNYEKGAHATIPIFWDQSTRTLRIGARTGSYPGMPEKLDLQVVWVRKGHGDGISVDAHPDKTLPYTGSEISIKANK